MEPLCREADAGAGARGTPVWRLHQLKVTPDIHTFIDAELSLNLIRADRAAGSKRRAHLPQAMLHCIFG
jgi:hypothetical protein